MFVCRRTVGHPIRISGRRMLIQTQGKVKSFCIFLYMPSIYHSEQINIQTLPFKCLVLVRFFWVNLWCFFLDSFMNRNSEEQHRFQTEFLYKYKLYCHFWSFWVYICTPFKNFSFYLCFKMPLLHTKAVYLTQNSTKNMNIFFLLFLWKLKNERGCFQYKIRKRMNTTHMDHVLVRSCSFLLLIRSSHC